MVSHAVRERIHPGIAKLACTAFVLALAQGAAVAQSIDIKQHGCKAGVELVARNAPLSQVLERLSASLGFRLDIEGEVTGSVNRSLSAPAPQLLAELLSSHAGHVIWHARDPRCPGQMRVARVWLVAASAKSASAATARPAALPAIAPAPPPAPMATTATREHLQQAEEESRRRKAAYDAYFNAHGRPPAGEPEEAARP
jgi:hypothetical protein